ncbi:P-loop containing nucleoside triphosphate hydrolase protein [Lentithecium fluviatile CBS 122367]|uniref:P-loop containing nucleoside triphosphate hydrolase protein n=1 Tax=Lentithecium fluviatile CBS 122367 TaxID=1168545 RepID=A0A6G1JDE7_9PLEO|nr:P-loop containing nucleoside triphosphate hydrolase protein [Lentithecium fluviatile CBS 122367]
MGDSVDEKTPPEVDDARGRISELEQRYIQLLESKIASLELQVAADKKNSSSSEVKAPSSVAGDAGSDNEDDKDDEDEPRYKVIISKWDSDAGDFKDTDATKKEKKKEIGPQNQPRRAFTLRKLTMGRPRYSAYRNQADAVSSEVFIDFEPLQQLIGKITHKWGWTELVLSCRSPYTGLVYAWTEAQEEAVKVVEDEPDEQKQARTDLGELLRLISTSSGYLPLDVYFKDRKTFIDQGTITHSALWTLFPPGTLIVARPFLDEPQIFSVQSCDTFVSEDQTFDLVCYCFDWNGYEFSRVPFQMKIAYWGPDRRSIIELPFYPLQYHVDVNAAVGENERSLAKLKEMNEKSVAELKEKLIERGKRFVSICTAPKGKQMFKYTGDAHFHTGRSLLHRSDDSTRERDRSDDSTSVAAANEATLRDEARRVSKKKVDGTTMVDFTSFYEYLSPNTPILGPMPRYEGQLETLSPERRANPIFREMYRFDWDKHPPTKEMTEDQYMLCPPRVLGYALKQKKWAQLLVDRLQPPDEADASTFRDKLQLDSELKELVQMSVQAHERGKETNKRGQPLALQDFAPDKGKGLVIMLYGYPGVGKTLTAESVALMAGKPLLSVGVSDIGIEGDKVEANLQKIFDLAGKWEAVLLFDEADVFLEARGEGENDLRRNAMVSVLLRVLEYYDGILILTTNRMKSFDIAVQSRIHIAIKYEELTQEQQIRIFDSFLDQLNEKKLVQNIGDLKKWVQGPGRKLQFNGRQIRNVVSTSLGIAMMDPDGDGRVGRIHLDRVAEQTKLFKQDLKSQEEIFKRITR